MITRSETPNRSIVFLTTVVILCAFYFAREVLIPIALAALCSFLLEPLVRQLQRFGMRRALAICAVLVAAIVVVGAVFGVVVAQIADLVATIPTYASNLHARFDPFIQWISHGMARFSDTAAGFAAGASEPATTHVTEVAAPAPARETSTPATIVLTQGVLLAQPLLTAGIVIVLVAFLLAQQQDLRDRVIRLLGSANTHITTEALDEASSRVSRYLLLCTCTNIAFAIIVGVGLFIIGVPNAALWGALSGALRYIPYFGAWIAPIFPFTLALCIFEDWGRPLTVVGMYLIVDLVISNVLEPWLYGSGTGLSPLAVLFAAIFWTWMWGAVGLLLSVPLTVCMLVLGKYVPHARYLHILLGDEPVLDPHMRFYQRLLAMDDEEANEIVAARVKEKGLPDAYETVVIPALEAAARDFSHGELDDRKRQLVLSGSRSIVAEMIESGDTTAPVADDAEQCICVGALSESDEIAAEMFADAARRAGFGARTAPLDSIQPADSVSPPTAQVIVISVVGPTSVSQARHVVKRLQRTAPAARLIVGFWNTRVAEQHAEQRLDAAGRVRVARSFSAAFGLISNAPAAGPVKVRTIEEPVRPRPSELPLGSTAAGLST